MKLSDYFTHSNPTLTKSHTAYLLSSPTMAALSPKPIPPCLTVTLPPSTPPLHSTTTLSFFPRKAAPLFIPYAKKKNPWLDPFDQGDDPEMEYGQLFSDGKQDEDPRPPDNPGNPYGFLKFPQGYAVEVTSLGLKIRGDVRRRCCCVVSGGVYDNLLFFPAILMVKDRYPGIQVDVVTTARGKQVYEINNSP